MAANWSVSKNTGHDPESGQLLFYLWAIERLAAFRKEARLCGHNWYREGGEVILDRQRENGGWDRYHESGYSLLFLSRATHGGTTGGRLAKKKNPGVDQIEGPLHFRALPGMNLTAWLREAEHDGTATRLSWLVDGVVIASHKIPEGTSALDRRFSLRHQFEFSGRKSLTVDLEVKHDDGSAETIHSDPALLTCHWTPKDWMARADAEFDALAKTKNLLRGRSVHVEASSFAPGQFATRAADGLEGTAWIAGSKDDSPWIHLRLAKSAKARALTLTQCASTVESLKDHGGVTKVEVTINDKHRFESVLRRETPGPVVLPFPKRRRVKSLKVTILEERPRGKKRGFSEIRLH